MATQAEARHRELERRLQEGRRAGALDETQEDAILEEMADLWDQMTCEERTAANARAAAASLPDHEQILSPEAEAALEAGIADVRAGRVVELNPEDLA